MPPKSNLTKEIIAQKAFSILRSEGYEKLNARYLASQLGVSTMPLFHYYENMDEIKAAAVGIGVDIYNEYMKKGMKAEIPFKGIGRAYIQFAKDEPELFKIFFMTADEKIVGLPKEDKNGVIALGIASGIMDGDKKDGSHMLRNMWVMVHGIATLEATGKLSFTEREISQMLSQTFMGLKNQIKKGE